jgi:hypothetical protein
MNSLSSGVTLLACQAPVDPNIRHVPETVLPPSFGMASMRTPADGLSADWVPAVYTTSSCPSSFTLTPLVCPPPATRIWPICMPSKVIR